MVSSKLLHQVIGACSKPDSVRIKDESAVNEKIHSIISHGAPALQVITDFDATLTRYHLDGNKCDSSYGIIATSPLVSSDYRDKAMELYKKYYPIEVTPTMTIQEKIPHMIEWYEKSHEYMISCQPPLKRSSIQDMVKLSTATLRDNAKTAVERMSQAGIPLLVLSAGIGDVVQAVLQASGIDLPNVQVISNFMQFDDAMENIVGFKEPLIHMYNKNEAAIHDDNSNYFKDLRSRHNIILLGDSLGDSNMDHGVADPKNVLKIGFLNAHFEQHLEEFMTAFDIVLVDDQSFDLVNLLLDHLLAPAR
ncbi:cytosolic 5'-nucleotidase 3 [Folsomia candida]|uniref:cytosolic 5'-nucleotidase 3 n=1 Tax=Folsomia candida TaxID=158441 RepID=UPI000B8FC534|nr:cytosolic 5'-nucleotidase 3 [Folsomia candida]XP_021962944.1 cytosolic 5'-nucleotidase 3 [Folsomia candida]XP_021962945.1 cytosolic 5'-nucleotidase 3 [Folsomia candida]